MIKKFNLALTPQSTSNDVIKYAQYLSEIVDTYQLGNASLPHVTLCQFHAEEKDIALVWKQACAVLLEHSIDLTFENFSCISFDKVTSWVFLMPNKRDILDKMHQAIARVGYAPSNKSYDPHMTLINTKHPKYKKKADELFKFYTPIVDTFILSLGECDSAGQFTQLLFKSEMKKV